MSEYTPTTEDVRIRYALDRGAAIKRPFFPSLADFDRWLAAHDAEVAARALREAADEFPDDLNDTPFVQSWLTARSNRIERTDR